MKNEYDVIVIGGGPGGSMAATLLAKSGHSVLVVEKEVFPRYHIGESLLSGTAELMKKIGVLEKVEKAGYIKKWGVEWLWGSEGDSWTVYFKDALAMPHDYGYQVERGSFDKMLLDNAAEQGVDVLQPATVIETIERDDRIVGLVLEDSNGDRQSIASAFVIDASGQGGFLTKRKNNISWDDKLRNMAIWSYWKNARRGEGIDSGNTFLPAFEDGWWWFIPLRDDVTSIGVIIDRENYDRVKSEGFESYYHSAISKTPELARRLENAELVDEVRVQRDWSYIYDKFYGKGFIAVGDAACFIDPLFSTGVHLAMLAGYLAATTINTILKNNSANEDALLAFYQNSYEAEYYRLRAQVYFLYSGHKSSKETYFWKARSEFDIPGVDPKQAFVSLIAGAFEHRSWYSRYLKHLEVPEHIKSIFEGRFKGGIDAHSAISLSPLKLNTDNWEIKRDYAIDGDLLKEADVICMHNNVRLPYDDYYQGIIELAQKGMSFSDMVKELSENRGLTEKRVIACIEKSVSSDLLSLSEHVSGSQESVTEIY